MATVPFQMTRSGGKKEAGGFCARQGLALQVTWTTGCGKILTLNKQESQKNELARPLSASAVDRVRAIFLPM